MRGTKVEGLPDLDLWTLSCTEKRLLITTDKGFTDIEIQPTTAFW